MGDEDEEEAAPPPPPPPPTPPPPLLPPPDATTIGKYIARFRYEQPRPREQRAAVHKSEFWWTLSPRYAGVGARSPSPPSSWASGSAFDFLDGADSAEESTGECEFEDEVKETGGECEEDEGKQSMSTLERKLRQRLGASSSGTDASEKSGGERVAIDAERVSWDALEWNSLELEEEASDLAHELLEVEEEEEEEEDPEEVIERVRRRLGLGSSSSSSHSSGSRPSFYRLSLNNRENERNGPSLLPPLSPVKSLKLTRDSPNSFGGDGSTCNWGSPIEMAGSGGQGEVALLSDDGNNARSESASPAEQRRTDGEELEKQVEDEEDTFRQAVSGEDVASEEACTTQSGDDDNYSAELTPIKSSEPETRILQSQTTAITTECASQPQPSPASDSGKLAAPQSPTDLPVAGLAGGSHESAYGEQQGDSSLSGEQQTGVVDGHSVLCGSNCALPESKHSEFVGASSTSSSKRVQAPGETTKTLDNLLSFVVHSWSEEFFSSTGTQAEHKVEQEEGKCEGEQGSGNADAESSHNTTEEHAIAEGDTLTPDIEDEKAHAEKGSETQDTLQEIVDPSLGPIAPQLGGMSSSNASLLRSGPATAVERPELISNADEDSADEDVPGEEQDEIVRVLLERIALFEEALRYAAD